MPKRFLAVCGIAIVLAFYAEVLLHAPATGQDFRLFYAAAAVVQHGGNPYDQRQLVREETRIYHPATTAEQASLQGNPWVQGPPLAIAFMAALPFPRSLGYAAYAATLTIAAATSLMILVRTWTISRPSRVIILGLLSPVTFLGIMLGQADAALLLALIVAIWLLHRNHPSWAAFVLSIGLFKPQIIAGPIVLLLMMAWRRSFFIAYTRGLIAGAAVFAFGSALIAGPAILVSWIRQLVRFGQSTVYAQVDISSLSSLYLNWLPHGLVTPVTLAVLLAWMSVTLLLWRRVASTEYELWWLALSSTLWLLATPYAHPHDDVILLLTTGTLFDRRAYRGTVRWLAVLLLVTWWLLPMTSVLGLRPPGLRGLGVVPVLLLAALLAAHRPQRHSSRREAMTTVVPIAS